MPLVLNCLFYDSSVTTALYIQSEKNDAIIISRDVIEKTLLFFTQKYLLLQLNGNT